MIDVDLSDPNCSDEDFGFIRLSIEMVCNDQKLSTEEVSFHILFSIVTISCCNVAQDRVHSGKDSMGHQQSSLHDGNMREKKSILVGTLLNGTDLPCMDQKGKAIPAYCVRGSM